MWSPSIPAIRAAWLKHSLLPVFVAHLSRSSPVTPWMSLSLALPPLLHHSVLKYYISGLAGCALSYIQGNGSYSMFAQILYATPSSANLSGMHSQSLASQKS